MNTAQPTCFISFLSDTSALKIPKELNNPFDYTPDPLCILAADEVQAYLKSSKDIKHNFGFGEPSDLKPHGKMFGVLVVQKATGELGYLMAFSGKLLGENNLERFVPSVGQTDRDEAFVNRGMSELTEIGKQIAEVEENLEHMSCADKDYGFEVLEKLMETRKAKSQKLQQQIFEAYYFSNAKGNRKTLLEIFANSESKRPPSGAGECSAPKLLQYAFDHKLKPIAMAEFWWGKSRKSLDKQHGHFYPACEDKCRPILTFMLEHV
jgi:tRNA pseudouridine32 synthase/23S rRNA pseudouridine746 synthase